MVELVQLSSGRGHEAAAIHGDHHLLPALSLHFNDDRAVPPRGRAPAHAAKVIATHVVPQTGESG